MPLVAETDTTARRAVRVAATLLVFDFLFIGADLLRHYGVLHDARFAVTTERGFGEWFQYAQSAVIVALLLRESRKAPAAVAWAGLFAYLLLDDAFELHERGGTILASMFSVRAIGPVRGDQLCELVMFAIVGAAFVVALWSILRRGDALSWWLSARLALPFAALVFFGAGVDLLHSALGNRSYRYAAGVIEDGGEMVAMTIILAVVYSVVRGRWFSVATPEVRGPAQ